MSAPSLSHAHDAAVRRTQSADGSAASARSLASPGPRAAPPLARDDDLPFNRFVMQSNARRSSPATILFCAVLPALGLLAEFAWGMMSSELSLFPTWWHVGFLGVAVLLNGALHGGLFDAPTQVLARAMAIGFVAGMVVLYGLAEAPMIPAMVFLAIAGLGVLAAAPYLAGLGLVALLPGLFGAWRRTQRSAHWLAALLVAAALAPLGITFAIAWYEESTLRQLEELAIVMRDPARGDEADRLAAGLRAGRIATQRAACRGGGHSWFGNEDDLPFRFSGAGIPSHRPFWFIDDWLRSRRRGGSAGATPDVRLAFHRAHGVSWNDEERVRPVGLAATPIGNWFASRIVVRPEPDAALAQVDHVLEVSSGSQRNEEAHFVFALPPGAVASSLSSWIDGAERPAAFAAQAQVGSAWAAVVARDRDPAMLREVRPGVLELSLFPLARNRPPMKVRVGFTVPFRCRGG